MVKYYWDASIFLYWLTGNHQDHSVHNSINSLAELCAQNKIIIVTSSMTLAEVLYANDTTDNQPIHQFKKYIKQYVTTVAVDDAIALEAAALRYANRPTRKIKTPDAIHLATAKIYCDIIHTTDADWHKCVGVERNNTPIQISEPSL